MRLKLLAIFWVLMLIVSCSTAPLSPSSGSADTAATTPVAPPVSSSLTPTDIPEPPEPEPPEPEPPPAVDYTDAAAALPPLIEAICNDSRVTGMSLAVFDANGVFYRQSYGMAVVETATPANHNTRFRIASVSKAVTAMLALRLVQQGELSLDDDLSSVVGYPLQNTRYPDSPITLHQLLTHTSGLVDSDAYWNAVATSPLPPVKGVLARSFGGNAPGAVYCYTNLGMGLVSGVIEGATDTRFLDYTREQVFVLRGIDAAYTYTDIADKDSVANIYSSGNRSVNMREWSGMTYKYNKQPTGQLYALGQAELIITANDLAEIARAMSGHPAPDDPLGLSPDTTKLLNTVQYEQPDTSAYAVDEIKRGMGTHITDNLVVGRRMVGHQGNAYGCICAMFWDPLTGTGFVMLTNGASGASNSSGIYTLFVNTANTIYDAFFTG